MADLDDCEPFPHFLNNIADLFEDIADFFEDHEKHDNARDDELPIQSLGFSMAEINFRGEPFGYEKTCYYCYQHKVRELTYHYVEKGDWDSVRAVNNAWKLEPWYLQDDVDEAAVIPWKIVEKTLKSWGVSQRRDNPFHVYNEGKDAFEPSPEQKYVIKLNGVPYRRTMPAFQQRQRAVMDLKARFHIVNLLCPESLNDPDAGKKLALDAQFMRLQLERFINGTGDNDNNNVRPIKKRRMEQSQLCN